MGNIYYNTPSSITMSPSNAKGFGFEGFATADLKYFLGCGNPDENNWASLLYVDRDVTIQGDDSGTYSYPDDISYYNVSLKKGWNYVISLSRGSGKGFNYTSSTSLPSSFKWFVFEGGL
jgi:hypothetical protein